MKQKYTQTKLQLHAKYETDNRRAQQNHHEKSNTTATIRQHQDNVQL